MTQSEMSRQSVHLRPSRVLSAASLMFLFNLSVPSDGLSDWYAVQARRYDRTFSDVASLPPMALTVLLLNVQSAAEGGCMAEVGVAGSMAAAGFVACMGGESPNLCSRPHSFSCARPAH
jgi:hypothetical protein